ncbi:MAG: hypothetical protein QOK18_2275 [Mycobacterium sp.]|nr:hypothetical protein [Mycobacterium sp.]
MLLRLQKVSRDTKRMKLSQCRGRALLELRSMPQLSSGPTPMPGYR